jgi:serine/threonine protein kinase
MNTIVPDQQDLVVELAEDFVARHRRGEYPSLDEYKRNYPEIASEVESLIDALLVMEKLGSKQSKRAKFTTDDIPDHLGEYQLLRELGRGGMGVVFEAVQSSLLRHVAVKVLPKQAMTNTATRDRFLREARLAAGLHHSHIVPVHGVGEEQGYCYFVMQLIDGVSGDQLLRSLRDHQKSKATAIEAQIDVSTKQSGSTPTTPVQAVTDQQAKPLQHWLSLNYSQRCVEAARVGQAIAEALSYAHEQGVLHRDIKPGNIIIDEGLHPWLNDFGLARPLDDSNLTATGQVVGTLRYLPPERFKGVSSQQGDVYALGLTLYELITSQSPFGSLDQAFLVKQIQEEMPASLVELDSSTSVDLNTIVMKCLAKDPQERYQSAASLARDLSSYLAGEPISARPLRWWEKTVRWMKRNPVVASLLGLIMALLSAGLVSSSLLYWKAEEARLNEKEAASKARDQATLATKARNEAEALNKFFLEQVMQASRPGVRGKDITLAKALEQSESSIHQYFAETPEVEVVVRNWLAETYRLLGKYRQSEAQFKQSKSIFEDLKMTSRESYTLLNASIANALFDQGRWAEALEYFKKFYELDKTNKLQTDRRKIDHNYVVALSKVSQQKEAYELAQKTYGELSEALGKEDLQTITAQVNWAYLCLITGRVPQGTKLAQDALTLLKKTEQQLQPVGLKARHMLLKSLIFSGKAQQALSDGPALLSDFQNIVGEQHSMTLELMNDIGVAYSIQKQYEKALEIQNRAAELFEEATGITNPETLTAWANVAICYFHLKKIPEALPVMEKVISQRRLLKLPADIYAVSLVGLYANCLIQEKQFVRAGEIAHEYVQLTEDKPALLNKATLANMQRIIGAAALSKKSFEESEKWLLKSWEYQKTAKDINDVTRRQTASFFVQLYEAWQKPEEKKKWESLYQQYAKTK